MKAIQFLIAFTLFCKCTSAQGNLQFNQIVRASYVGSTGPLQYSPAVIAGTITVPVNKVWKIESGSVLDSAALNTGKLMCLSVDGQLVYAVYNGGGGGGTTSFASPPIWLSSGTYDITVSNNDGYFGNIRFIAKISAIEYNIVQ